MTYDTSSNTQRRRPRRRTPKKNDVLAIQQKIEELLKENIRVTVGSRTVWMTRCEAIVRQLSQKTQARHRRAMKVLLRYLEFAAELRGKSDRVRLEFGDEPITEQVCDEIKEPPKRRQT